MSWNYAIGEMEPGVWGLVEVYLDADGEAWGWTKADLDGCEDANDVVRTLAGMLRDVAYTEIGGVTPRTRTRAHAVWQCYELHNMTGKPPSFEASGDFVSVEDAIKMVEGL